MRAGALAGKSIAYRVAIAGVCGALSIVLAVTRWGFIPVPTPAKHATILHVPAIVAGIFGGPLAGALAGFIFGAYSFLYATVPLFKDPLVAFLPRVLIGPVAWAVFELIRRLSWENTAAIASAVFGTLTNTVGVLGLAVLLKYMPYNVAVYVGLTHGIPETIVACLIVWGVYRALRAKNLLRG